MTPVLSCLPEIDERIIIQLPDSDIMVLRKLCRYLRHVVSNDSFWHLKLMDLFAVSDTSVLGPVDAPESIYHQFKGVDNRRRVDWAIEQEKIALITHICHPPTVNAYRVL